MAFNVYQAVFGNGPESLAQRRRSIEAAAADGNGAHADRLRSDFMHEQFALKAHLRPEHAVVGAFAGGHHHDREGTVRQFQQLADAGVETAVIAWAAAWSA